jgi:hypothetical protein
MTKPTIEEVAAIDISPMMKYIRNYRSKEFINAAPGVEHYKLLGWFAMQFNDIQISEVGTLDGCGTLALSINPRNQVKTWDIHFYPDCCMMPDNANRYLLQDKIDWIGEVVKSHIIFYDTAHDGKIEREFLDELLRRDWHGILIWDDIHFNIPMEKFWDSITQEKEDWSELGHITGSGVMFL